MEHRLSCCSSTRPTRSAQRPGTLPNNALHLTTARVVGVRVRLWLLFAYLANPVDLIPDFVPVLGYADDAIIVAAVLRSVVQHAGPDAIRRNWPGTPEGLSSVWTLARLEGSI